MEEIAANQNRTPAGKLENGVLTVQLELRNGAWRPEADDGPQLFVPAFGEAGHPAQIPGPLLRMPAGTTVHATVTNKLKKKATIYGLNTRPGDAKAGTDLAPGESHEFTFAAGAPGTYYYWARTVTPADDTPYLADAQLNGAFVVDPAGTIPADRILVLNLMIAPADVLHHGFEVATINGKSFPYTEPLEYAQGETIRWRVINPGFSEHPMHLHGAFYQVLSWGDFESETAYVERDRQWVVTQNLLGGHTMMVEWTPEHAGRWLFHCHFHTHMSTDERVPVLMPASDSSDSPNAFHAAHQHSYAMDAMNDMAGLVITINVKANPASMPARPADAAPAHKVDLVIEPRAANAEVPTFSCAVREGKKIVASQDESMGPPIVLTRGEPTEITVLNHLAQPTTIHWHGLELESYYDGVVGGGDGNQITPTIAPGSSFTARFTPNRAGTFIYHTHAGDAKQLSGGIYGALIVMDPGEKFDPEHDKLLMVGTRDTSFFAKRITLNGAENPSPIVLKQGAKYRFRVINMAPDLAADFQLGSKEHPATWRAIAKDGANLPARLAQTSNAILHFDSGEAYDFEFQPDSPGEVPLQVQNSFAPAKLVGKMIVQ